MKRNILTLIGVACFGALMAQTTVTISPSKDNTLYESVAGDISNGAGDYLFFGQTNGGDIRRTVIAFDVSSQLQAGDSVISVTLKMELSKANNSNVATNEIHALTKNWGEGGSNAPSDEGQGTSASVGDATWTEAFFGGVAPDPWATAGGDFQSAASTTFDVTGEGSYNVSGAGLVTDVQSWLDNPSTNFGWIILGKEGTNASAKRINSRENSTEPVSLDITFVRPVSLNKNSDLASFKIYPNPVGANFEIKGIDDFQSVQIFDLNGQLRKNLNTDSKIYDISDLSRGIYFLKIESNGKNITQKLIKQ